MLDSGIVEPKILPEDILRLMSLISGGTSLTFVQSEAKLLKMATI
jgi:hypothetical protein